MPVRNYPFSITRPGDIARPYLPVAIINPESGKRLKVFALVDTGADECALPASFAPILGHNLQAGQERKINTGNGVTTAYSHTTRIEIEGIRHAGRAHRFHAEPLHPASRGEELSR